MAEIVQINQHVWIDQSKLLGKGSTGNVYFGGSYRDPNMKFAVKAIDLSEVNNQVTQYLLSCEIVALSELGNLNVEHVVKLHDIAFQEGFCYLVMELLEGGSLAEYIKENPNGLNDQQVQQLFKQLFQGYKSIRNLGIVHRDIKPDNIIFRHKLDPNNQNHRYKKLCYIDFGYCTKQSVPNRPQVYYNVGSPKYMAPEAYKKNNYSEKSDIWALGVILYEMLHGKTIDKDMDMDEYMRFMELSQIPFANSVTGFLKNLVCRLLEVDVSKRISCEEIEQMLKANHFNKQHANNNHQLGSQQFLSFVPQLNIQEQSMNKRNSPFYRSQIITHRSDPSQSVSNFYSRHQPFDPRRQQRNFSQENDLHQFRQSPKKIIHLEHSQHKATGIVSNLPFEGDSRQLVQKFRHFEQRNYSKQFLNGQMGPVKRQLENIQQEHENDASRQHLMRINSTVQNFRIQPDMKRSFLKAINQNHFQSKVELQQNSPILNNPNVRFLNINFAANPPSLSKTQQLVQSQIFHMNNDERFNTGKNLFSSYIDQNPQKNIKVITSDKTINNRIIDQQEVEMLGRNLNKSYSTNNITQKVQIRSQNQPFLIHSHFAPLPFNPNQSFQPINALPNQGIRPIDLLIQNKQISNSRAFLRNTVPNIYRSTIQPVNFFVNQQYGNYQKNLENSNDLIGRDSTVIEPVNHSNFKKHGSYFDQNFVKTQKKNNTTVTQFKKAQPFTVIQNRNQKIYSFKVVQNEAPQIMQRDRTVINLLNQSFSPVNQQLKFNQPIIQGKQKQAPINILTHKPMQQQQQVNGQNFQVGQGQQSLSMGQSQEKNVFFGNVQQRNIPSQNMQAPQNIFQTINLQQPTRNIDNQFRRSAIINLFEHANQQTIQSNPNRNFVQNQNSSFQQHRQPLIIGKPIFSQVLQPQRQILVNTINQNPEINKMVRPTYPLVNQHPITVTHF